MSKSADIEGGFEARGRNSKLDFRNDTVRTMIFSAATVGLNFVTGIIVARLLGPSGRGALTAILIVPNVAAFLVTLGASQALAFAIAQGRQQIDRLLGTWLATAGVVFIVTVVGIEAALPRLLAAQSSSTLAVARLWALTIGFSLFGDVFSGVLLGERRYLLFNIVRFLPIGISSGLYIGVALSGRFSLVLALTCLAVGAAGGLVVSGVAVLSRHRPSKPSRALAASTLWYGLRVHGNLVGTVTNARLDLLILPGFLAASSVGIYSVASNMSWVVVTIVGAVSSLVLPQAARLRHDGSEIVASSLRIASLVAIGIAVAMALLAKPVIELAYGRAFDSSLLPLLLMLPGSVCYAAAYVLSAGLASLGQPGKAAISQVPGVIVTVAGLAMFLRTGGLVAAALISTAAYTSVFVLALLLYMRAAQLGLSQILGLGASKSLRLEST